MANIRSENGKMIVEKEYILNAGEFLSLFFNAMFNRVTVLFLIFIFAISHMKAQFKLPEGYTISLDMNDSSLSIKADFNKDGKKDLFAIISNQEKTRLVSFLSKGKKFVMHLSKEMEYFDCCSSILFEKNILKLSSNGMRYFEYYKLRYNPKISTFEVIGIDSESFGNAAHDGAGTQSLNLLNGQYEYSFYTANSDSTGTTNTGNKKLKLPVKYTITNFGQALEFFQNADNED